MHNLIIEPGALDEGTNIGRRMLEFQDLRRADPERYLEIVNEWLRQNRAYFSMDGTLVTRNELSMTLTKSSRLPRRRQLSIRGE